MKLLVPAFSNFLKNKKLKIYIISISIFFGTIISIIYSLYQINTIFSDRIKNNIKNRVILIRKDSEKGETLYDSEIKCISNMENIDFVYTKLEMFNMNLDIENKFLISFVSEEELPIITNGNKMDSNEENQIIIPDKILANNEYISSESLIGKIIKLYAEDFSIEAKVCGIYNSKNYEKIIYINDTLKNYFLEYNEEFENKHTIYAIANKYSYVENIIQELKENEYDAYLKNEGGQNDIKIYNMALTLMVGILCFSVVFIYVTISIVITGIISDEKMDIAILKALGYRIKDISSIIKFRIIAIIGISSAFGFLISIILNQLIRKLIGYKLFIKMEVNVKLYGTLFLLLLISELIISLLSIKINNIRIKKLNTIQLLKEN